MAQRGAEGDAGLTQSLAEKMQAVIERHGVTEVCDVCAAEVPQRLVSTHRQNHEREGWRGTERCPMCEKQIALPLFEGHLAMHGQAARCPICGHAGKLDEHLAHLRAVVAESEAAQAESFRVVAHAHGEPTAEQRVVGEAVRAVITAELDGTALESLAARLYAKQAELAYFFGYGGGVWTEPVAWDELPARYRAWIVATVNELIKDGVITCG